MAHMLVIDDNPAARSRVTLMLEKLGHRVTSAADGDEGIRMYRQEPADIVFCDIFMPRKDGIETLMELLQEFPDVKVISMGGDSVTGRRSPAAVDTTLLGAVGSLQKPFTPDLLEKVIARVLPPS